jgi:uncharacterized protein (DUF433 family)
MNWQDRVEISEGVLLGKPIIKGTRISVEFIIELLSQGWSNEQILAEYDHITQEDIQACLCYAHEAISGELVYPLSV